MKKDGNKIILKGALIIDGIHDEPLDNYSILIEGKKIKNVEKRIEAENAREINVEGKTIIPGLIDCHVHLYFNSMPDPNEFFLSPISTWAIEAACNAGKYIKAGFTTIRDLGSPGYIGISVRNCINSGIIPGPRILASGGPLGATGGHGQSFPPWVKYKEEFSELVDGETEIRKAIRKQAAAGVDWIKVATSGGITDPVSMVDVQELSNEEIKVVMSEARRVGKPVSAHAEGINGIKAAIRAGVRSIEHGVMLNDETIKQMIRKGIFLIPTLSAFQLIKEKGLKGGIPKYAVEKNKEITKVHKKSFKKALDSGVKIAMGTDAGAPFNFHGENAYELELMNKYGMTPMQTLKSATKTASELLKLADKIGSIEPNKFADLIIVKGNPLADITLLQKKENIEIVLKEGKIVKSNESF
jgi:imidazolonepropionase-like amidohydrolase